MTWRIVRCGWTPLPFKAAANGSFVGSIRGADWPRAPLLARAPCRHFRTGIQVFNDEPVELSGAAALQQLKAAIHGASFKHRSHLRGSLCGACQVNPAKGVAERDLLAVGGGCKHVKAGHRWLSEWLGFATIASRLPPLRAVPHTAAPTPIRWVAHRPRTANCLWSPWPAEFFAVPHRSGRAQAVRCPGCILHL